MGRTASTNFSTWRCPIRVLSHLRGAVGVGDFLEVVVLLNKTIECHSLCNTYIRSKYGVGDGGADNGPTFNANDESMSNERLSSGPTQMNWFVSKGDEQGEERR